MAPTLKAPPGIVTMSTRALFDEVIDYAGLFPPAELPLDEALPAYARYRRGATAWMLGRFVVPAGRLAELTRHEELIRRDPPCPFSVLAGRGEESATYLAALERDLALAARFRQRFGETVRLEAFETRLPVQLVGDGPEALSRLVRAVDAHVGAAGLLPPDVYFEVPIDGGALAWLPDAAALLGSARPEHLAGVGLKVRTGGLEATAFPSTAALAAFIAICRDAGLRFKATAGLHHPLRHADETLGITRHGFLNLFGAAVLAHALRLDPATTAAVLDEADDRAFYFAPDAFGWRDLRVDPAAVRQARRELAVSFGSCSFDEPVEDLEALRLL